MICKSCGQELNNNSKFCNICGCKVDDEPSAADKTYCFTCMKECESKDGVCPDCGNLLKTESAPHHLCCGTILNNKFLVGNVLGEVGFGITYIGRDLKLDIRVAIKEFFPNGYVNRNNTATSEVTCSVSQESRDHFNKGKDRFLKEARILASFSSEPGIVSVRDYFEENNTAYIIMEYLEGKDLKTYLEENQRLSPQETIDLLMPVMKSLIKIHKQGLIHRDISPDNIRITPGGVKLLDFGAARKMSAIADKSLSVMLKHGYAPEEQYRSRGEQGPWTDVYALCATMYKCITGITPEYATQRSFSDDLKSPSELGITIDKKIENAIMSGMAVYKKDRLNNVEELICALSGNDLSLPSELQVSENLSSKDQSHSDNDKTVFMGQEYIGENESVFNDDKTVYVARNEQESLNDNDCEIDNAVIDGKKKNKKKTVKIIAIMLSAIVLCSVIAIAIIIPHNKKSGKNSFASTAENSVGSLASNTNVESNAVSSQSGISTNNNSDSLQSDVEFGRIGTLDNGVIDAQDIWLDVGDGWRSETGEDGICFSKYEVGDVLPSSMIEVYYANKAIDLNSIERPSYDDFIVYEDEMGTLTDGESEIIHECAAGSYSDVLYVYTYYYFNIDDTSYLVRFSDNTDVYSGIDKTVDRIHFKK